MKSNSKPLFQVSIPKDVVKGDCFNVTQVHGHCMEPTIMDGAMIGFDFEDKEIVVGEIFIFKVRGANPPWQVKRVTHYEPSKQTKTGTYLAWGVLGTDNPQYLNMMHNIGPGDDAEVVGKVKWICNEGYVIDYEIEK